LVEGLGTVNSLNIDRLRDFLYIADRGRRAIWVVPLAGEGPRKPRVFHRSSEFDTVSGVAGDGQSNVWVAVYDKANVVVFSPDGTQVSLIP
jgi:sugar lactone lactonase YvrE